MSEIHETALPGVGVRHEFVTKAGTRLGVVTHRTGQRELLVYDRRDPDSCEEVVRLDQDDSRTLAELLGAATVADRLARLQQSVEGLVIDWLFIEESWKCVGQTIRHYEVRKTTGVSIVAALRGEETIAVPSPDEPFRAGDTLVVVGTAEGVRETARLLRDG